MWTLVFAFLINQHPTMTSATFENKTQCVAALHDLAHYAATSKREEELDSGLGTPLITWFGKCYHSTNSAAAVAAPASPAPNLATPPIKN